MLRAFDRPPVPSCLSPSLAALCRLQFVPEEQQSLSAGMQPQATCPPLEAQGHGEPTGKWECF